MSESLRRDDTSNSETRRLGIDDSGSAEVGDETIRHSEEAGQTNIDIRALGLHFHEGASMSEVAELLRAVESVAPGSVDKLLESTLEDSAHRRQLEQTGQRWWHHRALLGQVGAFVLGVIGVTLGFVLALRGRPIWGLVWMLSIVVPLVGINIYDRRQPRRQSDAPRMPGERGQR